MAAGQRTRKRATRIIPLNSRPSTVPVLYYPGFRRHLERLTSFAVNPRERDSRLFIDLSDQSRGLLSSASTQHKLLRLIGKRRYGPGSIRLDFKCPP